MKIDFKCSQWIISDDKFLGMVVEYDDYGHNEAEISVYGDGNIYYKITHAEGGKTLFETILATEAVKLLLRAKEQKRYR